MSPLQCSQKPVICLYPVQKKKRPVHAISLLLVCYSLHDRVLSNITTMTQILKKTGLLDVIVVMTVCYSRDDSMFLNDVSVMQMDRHMQIELRQ